MFISWFLFVLAKVIHLLSKNYAGRIVMERLNRMKEKVLNGYSLQVVVKITLWRYTESTGVRCSGLSEYKRVPISVWKYSTCKWTAFLYLALALSFIFKPYGSSPYMSLRPYEIRWKLQTLFSKCLYTHTLSEPHLCFQGFRPASVCFWLRASVPAFFMTKFA